MKRNKIKSNNAVQTIIINSISEQDQNYLCRCKTTF